jgi:hypothetical protein
MIPPRNTITCASPRSSSEEAARSPCRANRAWWTMACGAAKSSSRARSSDQEMPCRMSISPESRAARSSAHRPTRNSTCISITSAMARVSSTL